MPVEVLICWMGWVSLKPRSRLLVTRLPYTTKYPMLCSVRRHCRSVTLMLDAMMLTTTSAT